MSDRYIAKEENDGRCVSYHGASFVVVDTEKLSAEDRRDGNDPEGAIVCFCVDLDMAEAVASAMNFQEYEYQGVFDND